MDERGGGGVTTDETFTSYTRDIETGLYYAHHRYYDPSVGRFISPDPAKDGENWYVYAGNNPLRFVDPTGLVIRVSTHYGRKFTKHYNIARDYLVSNSPTAAHLFKRLEEPDVDVVIMGGEETTIDPYITSDPISWASTKGLRVESSNKIMSPALCLAHELGHKYLSEFDEKYQKLEEEYGDLSKELKAVVIERNAAMVAAHMLDATEEDRIRAQELDQKMIEIAERIVELEDKIENEVLEKFEKPIAEELNEAGFDEGIREDYDDVPKDPKERTRRTKDPTSTEAKVICKELYLQGFMDKEIFEADEEFGRYLKEHYPKVLLGYLFWAQPTVKLMKKSREFTLFVNAIAKPWTYEMAYRMGKRENGDFAGFVIMTIGIQICLIIGNIITGDIIFILSIILLIFLFYNRNQIIQIIFKNSNFLQEKKLFYNKNAAILLRKVGIIFCSISLILILFSCQDTKLTDKIDFETILYQKRDLQLEIYYRKFPSMKFDDYASVKMIKEGHFDYKVIINSDILIDNKGLLERINNINLEEKLSNYGFDAFIRGDFITKKYGLIYSFGLGSILEENIIWVNGDYYKIKNEDYKVFNAIKDTFMPFEYAFPEINPEDLLK